MENSTGKFQLIPQLSSIAQIAVVCNGHVAFLMIYFNRLTVTSVGAPSGAIPGMANSHSSLGKPIQSLCVKHLADEA